MKNKPIKNIFYILEILFDIFILALLVFTQPDYATLRFFAIIGWVVITGYDIAKNIFLRP